MTCWKCHKDMTEMRKLGVVEEAILLLTPGKRFLCLTLKARGRSKANKGLAGRARHGAVGRGLAWDGRRGLVWHGMAR